MSIKWNTEVALECKRTRSLSNLMENIIKCQKKLIRCQRHCKNSQSTDHLCVYLKLPGSTLKYSYTPGIYAEGYIVFVFRFIRSYVRSFICSFVRTSVTFVELLQSFTCKQLEWSISHQPLIRKHSYLDRRYPGGLTFIP